MGLALRFHMIYGWFQTCRRPHGVAPTVSFFMLFRGGNHAGLPCNIVSIFSRASGLRSTVVKNNHSERSLHTRFFLWHYHDPGDNMLTVRDLY